MKSSSLRIGAVLLLVFGAGSVVSAKAPTREMSVNVLKFGAKGDGVTDDTAAFQKALDSVGKAGGVVGVPAGKYMIKGHLTVPDCVTLEGVSKMPASNQSAKLQGSVLLAVEGENKPDGDPFILLNIDSCLKGVTIFYPNQDLKKPKAYPWTVRGQGANMTILDVLMINPWQAVDFSLPTGRHLIRGLYAGALHRGIVVDQCWDVGRIEDVHFWPFYGWNEDGKKIQSDGAIAFDIAKTDWEYMTNCFCFGYDIGFRFRRNAGRLNGNVVLTQSGADMSRNAVQVDSVQAHSGIAFSNCQMMGRLVVGSDNFGPVKFSNCGFWAVPGTDTFAVLEGHANVTFTGCHFHDWGLTDAQAPCILAKTGSLLVSSCDFMADKPKIRLEENVAAASILGNYMRGGEKITNNSKGKVQIGLNVE